MAIRFRDRVDAGRRLGEALRRKGTFARAVVFGLARGGVPVAYEVARAIGGELDVFVVRKLGLPGHRELAAGAIASGGVRVLNPEIAAYAHPAELEDVARREAEELERREHAYREGREPVDPRGRPVVLVDDGLATGASMRAAVLALRKREPARITVAVPVASPEACIELEGFADDVICLSAPSSFEAVGEWYDHFGQVSDDEVRALLQADAEWRAREGPAER